MLHNSYQYSGGEDISTFTEVDMLRQAGHDVALELSHNQEIQDYSLSQQLQLAVSSAWSVENYRIVRTHIQSTDLDLVHVQNFFPLLSPSIHTAAKSCNIPTVQHLRNFRLGCLSPYLFRDGHICETCVGKNPWRGILHRCYRQSLPASASLWGMITLNRFRGTWHREVDAFITPSKFAAEKLIQIGVPSDRLHIKPNIVADPLRTSPISSQPSTPEFLYAGRLSPEKGVMTLLKAWQALMQPDWRLILIGDGAQRDELEQFVSHTHMHNVEFRGSQSASEVLKAIRHATAVVVPSQWYEVFGRVVVEAFACGRGVLVADLGALPELVKEGETGFLIPHNEVNLWTERLQWCGQNATEMLRIGQRARQTYLQLYTPDINYQQMMDIYRQVLK